VIPAVGLDVHGVSLPGHARARPGHPRLSLLTEVKTWMAGTSPAMTNTDDWLFGCYCHGIER
jgi:hypothetical protein